jgi:hypothetical protein
LTAGRRGVTPRRRLSRRGAKWYDGYEETS